VDRPVDAPPFPSVSEGRQTDRGLIEDICRSARTVAHMAPAIAHFLVGASLLLVFALPLCLRYGIDREYGLWLVPLGGLWGITPDLHNIAPLFQRQLYAFHGSRWVDLFGLHYTLDRPIVRQEYLGSVFGSILAFCLAVAVFWAGFRVLD